MCVTGPLKKEWCLIIGQSFNELNSQRILQTVSSSAPGSSENGHGCLEFEEQSYHEEESRGTDCSTEIAEILRGDTILIFRPSDDFALYFTIRKWSFTEQVSKPHAEIDFSFGYMGCNNVFSHDLATNPTLRKVQLQTMVCETFKIDVVD